MEQNLKISVIVPVYKVEQYLNRCVDSILAQTYKTLEIILVDDGSPDKCGAVCDEYAARDGRIRVIHKPNGGLSSARNAGIDIATGDYIAFVDSDDWIEPDTYEHLLAAALRHDVKLVCAGRYDVSSATGEKTRGLCPPREEVVTGKEMARRIFLWENMDSASWDKLYHQSLFREIRFPLGKIVEDVPIMYLIALDAGRVCMCDKPVYNYYHRPGSITTARISEKTFHFAGHTEIIYDYIRENVPEIANEARYFRIRSLTYSLFSIALALKEDRGKFAAEGRKFRSQLRSHFGFILKSPFFSKKDKLTYVLLGLGIYRWLRPLYHAVK